ncbi:F-box domain-containing protein [Caenorhabditis elegans]|uniref:F-box domain-containing protein n=1 Tax=Caenorhabditis elegans TaxID=6239 RepID=O16739_CAEEL|nr:F-box domain-containing protein [Caenorhabditis elegans]CCD71257.1 F-box domain-containing protein [Caenorhabditis elegans]|eukprot:NP_494052.2 F-box A protein [Caenorhabditis elegans]
MHPSAVRLLKKSFDNFCRKVGNDVMPYSEFDFWYYRFYNGNHDLHYDRSSDLVPRSLSNMPLHMINEILNHVNIFDLLSLMKTSRSFQEIVQDKKLYIDSVEVGFYEGQYSRMRYNDRYEISYQQEKDGCALSYYDYTTSSYEVSEIFVVGENYVDRCNEDFKLMMENQSVQLDSFQLDFDDNCEQGFRDKCIDGVKKALKSSRRVTSKSVETDSVPFPDIARLVASFPAEKLENIGFDGFESEGYEQLIRLDQWKRARTLRAHSKMTVPFEHFFMSSVSKFISRNSQKTMQEHFVM